MAEKQEFSVNIFTSMWVSVRDVYMPIWLTESHLESDAFFFPVESQIESLAFFSGIPAEWNPRGIPQTFFGILQTIIGIPYESQFIFQNPMFIPCCFRRDQVPSHSYLGRQKLVSLQVSESSLLYTIRLNTEVFTEKNLRQIDICI